LFGVVPDKIRTLGAEWVIVSHHGRAEA